MKDNKLFKDLNDIDEKIIQEAEMKEYVPERKFNFMKTIIPVIAVAIIVLMVLPKIIGNDIKPGELPMVSMGTFNDQGSGFGALMAYNIKEIISSNPWNEDLEISTLPVFKNKLKYNDRGIPTNIDIGAMRERMDEIIALLKINPKELEITDDYPTEEEIREITEKIEATGGDLGNEFLNINPIYCKSKNYEVTVYKDLSITINFKPNDKLIKEYYIEYNAPFKDVYKTAKHVSKEYKSLLRMKEPVINIEGGDYSYDGEQSFNINFYDAEGSLEEQIINYNFNSVHFYFDDEDKSNSLRINKPDLSEKVGSYPIITSSEAKELLIDNKYITNVPEEFPGVGYIKKVELVYRGKYEENFMPYYLFYVELEDWKEKNNLNTYGIYYVPAVKEEYIDNMDVMDAKFN